MSLYGTWKTGTIAINETSTAEIDLDRDWEHLCLILPTMTSGTVKVQVSDKTGGTFQDLGRVPLPTTTGAYTDTLRLGGWRYIKVVSSASQAAARTITVRGFRY